MLAGRPGRGTSEGVGALVGTPAFSVLDRRRPTNDAGQPRCPPDRSPPSVERSCPTSTASTTTQSRRRTEGPRLLQKVQMSATAILIVKVDGKITHRDVAAVSRSESASRAAHAGMGGTKAHDGKIFRLFFGRALALAACLGPGRWRFTQIPSVRGDHRADQAHPRMPTAHAGRRCTSTAHPHTRAARSPYGMDPRTQPPGRPDADRVAESRTRCTTRPASPLITASVRSPGRTCLDPKIHHNNCCRRSWPRSEGKLPAPTTPWCSTRGFTLSEPTPHPPTCFMVTAGRLATPDHCVSPGGASPGATPRMGNGRPRPGIGCGVGDYTRPQLYNARSVRDRHHGLGPTGPAVDAAPSATAPPAR